MKSAFFLGIAIAAARWALLCERAQAFDYPPYGAQASSSAGFRIVDQPYVEHMSDVDLPIILPEAVSAPTLERAPQSPGAAVPTVNPESLAPGWPVAQPGMIPVVPYDYGHTWATGTPATSPDPTSPIVESTVYFRIDAFHWNEQINGHDFVNEDGPFFTLGYQYRSCRNRVRAEVFGSQVHYFAPEIFFSWGDVESLSSVTNYFGLLGEYEFLFEPEVLPRIDFFIGLGSRFWLRNLPSEETASGNRVIGYTETWWTFYPYVGTETRHNQRASHEWYFRGLFGITAFTLESANVSPRVSLSPEPGGVIELEAGWRGKSWFVGGFFEGMGWGRSAWVHGWAQPESTMVLLGLKTGVNF